jgi:hypothetical protein
MPKSPRDIVLPLFALVTLEARSIEQRLPRLGEKQDQVDVTGRSGESNRIVAPTKAG